MPKLKKETNPNNGDVRHVFDCPGCKMEHAVVTSAKSGPVWGFNNDLDRPTFTPSISVKYSYIDQTPRAICHSFVTDGKIKFLSDCTHSLSGQTVDLPEYDAD